MQIKTRDQSMSIEYPGLTVAGHSALGRCWGSNAKLLDWELMAKPLTTERMKELMSTNEDESHTSEDNSNDDPPLPMVHEEPECDTGDTDIPSANATLEPEHGSIPEAPDMAGQPEVGLDQQADKEQDSGIQLIEVEII